MPAVHDMAVASVSRLLTPRCAGDGSQPARSVLYLDDDWQNLGEWCATLVGAGYSVSATDSPAVAMSAFVRSEFDVVVLNFHLPYVTSGILGQVMRMFRRDIPLLLVSDAHEGDDLSPWDRQLSEGVDPAQFLANLQAVIEDGRRARVAAAVDRALARLPQ